MKGNSRKEQFAKNTLQEKIISFLEILVALFIVFIDTIAKIAAKVLWALIVITIRTPLRILVAIILKSINGTKALSENAFGKHSLVRELRKLQISYENAVENLFEEVYAEPKPEEISIIEEIYKEKETKGIYEIETNEEIVEEKKERKSFRIPLLLQKRAALAYLAISFIIICGGLYAYFSDRAIAQADFQVGTVLVKLDEDAPFDDLGSIPEAGAETDEKTFRAISVCSIDTYVRARIIPIIEIYDDTEGCYVVIPIDVDDIQLSVSAPNWQESGGYYYYKAILKPAATSSDITVTVTGIGNSGDFEDTDTRITLRVELEAATARNDSWKQTFNIQSLPF